MRTAVVLLVVFVIFTSVAAPTDAAPKPKKVLTGIVTIEVVGEVFQAGKKGLLVDSDITITTGTGTVLVGSARISYPDIGSSFAPGDSVSGTLTVRLRLHILERLGPGSFTADFKGTVLAGSLLVGGETVAPSRMLNDRTVPSPTLIAD